MHVHVQSGEVVQITNPRRLARRAASMALLLAGLALAVPGLAKPGHGDHRGGPGSFLLRNAEQIGIDEATLAEIESLVDAAREDGKALHEEQRRAHETLRALLEQDEPDTDAVMKQAESIGEIDLRMQQRELQTLLAVRAKLTPEQRAALKQRRDEMRERFGKRGGHGMHHGGPGGCEGRDAPPAESAS